MSRDLVERDFLGLEKKMKTATASPPMPKFQRLLERRRSFREIQGAISKIDPEIIRSVIASGAPSHSSDSGSQFYSPGRSVSVPSTPKDDLPLIPPVHASVARRRMELVPMTIFYNGTISVFNVSPDKAESILKVALEASSSSKVESSKPDMLASSNNRQQLFCQNLEGDLPIARRKSLQRFLMKRKERIVSVSPYSPMA